MLFYPNDRLAIFIDGENLYAAARSLEIEIDFGRLRDVFARKCTLIRSNYYTTVYEEQDYTPVRPLIDWLDYNGYRVISKPVKEYADDSGRRNSKGSVNMEIAVDMLGLVEHLDHMVLISGDGNFQYLVKAVQDRGVRVSVVSTTVTNPPMIADELRRQADNFIELDTLRTHICRTNGNNGGGTNDRGDGDD